MTQKIQVKKLDIQDYFTSGPGSLNAKILQSISSDPKLEIIFKRAERLRMALLLLYGKLENKDTDLLKLANKIIFLVSDFANPSKRYSDTKQKMKITLLQISELLDFYYVEQQLSLSNLQILKDAILAFVNVMEDFESALVEQDLHFEASDFFAVSSKPTQNYKGHIKDTESIKDKKEEISKGHIKDTEGNTETTELHKGHVTAEARDKSATESNEERKNEKETAKRKHSLELEAELQSRRLKIIELLKSEPNLTASQIREKLGSDWSQKTIQRELLSMLKEEILEKEGEKRWTKYRVKF